MTTLGEISEARKETIKSGYDHYWRFHKNIEEFAELGCPTCKLQLEELNVKNA